MVLITNYLHLQYIIKYLAIMESVQLSFLSSRISVVHLITSTCMLVYAVFPLKLRYSSSDHLNIEVCLFMPLQPSHHQIVTILFMHHWGPQGVWGSGENSYLFSGSWEALIIILGELGIGLARLIEISVNRLLYKRKTIIDMKIQNRLLLMDVLSIYSIKSKRNCLLLFSV